MSYDPRRVSEGGNRGIDEEFSRYAPKNKFRVIGVDMFDGTDWLEGDFDSLEYAMEHATERGGEMLMMHVYDDRGVHQYDVGRF